MAQTAASRIPAILKTHEKELFAEWMRQQLAALTLRSDLLKEADLREQSRTFLNLVQEASQKSSLDDIGGSGWEQVRDMLGDLTRSRMQAGFSPGETASFVFSLKRPLFDRLRTEVKNDADALAEEMWRATVVVGMQPSVAITLVELGLPLDGVQTALNVEKGMALLQRRLETGA